MKVLVVHGSPRKQGNSSFLAGKLAESLGSPDVREVRLADLQYKGCSGCMACRKKAEECVMRDGLSPVLADIKKADVTILAAPIYQEYLNGDMKCLIDRFFSFLAVDHFSRLAAGETDVPTRLGPGKTVVTLLAQGQPETLYPYLDDSLTAVMKEMGFAHIHIARCCRLNSAKDSREREDLFAMLDGMAEEIRSRHA
jgi:multimeric flavodoxin WrbA